MSAPSYIPKDINRPELGGPDGTNRPTGPWFYLGCMFVAVGLIAFFWAFFTCVDQSRKFLLLWLLPLVSGVAAGCFAGSLHVERNKLIGVTATGGFAVFLLTFWMLGKIDTGVCESSEIGYTWLPQDQYHTLFLLQEQQHRYPAGVSGRLNNGKEQFKAEWSESPPLCWDSRSGLSKGAFEKKQASMKASGYELQSEQHFEGAGGAVKYQATWIKNDVPCE